MAKRAKAKTASKRAKVKAKAKRKAVVKSAAKKGAAGKPARPKALAKKSTAGRTTNRKKRTPIAARKKSSSGVKRSVKKAIAAKVVKKKKRACKKRTARLTPAQPEPVDLGSMQVFPADCPLPQTHLSDAQLERFRQLLLKRRAELAGDVRQLTSEVLNQTGGASTERSAMPIHMADLGSDNWEQEFTLGLIANERIRVQEIDNALARIADKTYGVCLATHKRISVARLRAKPWAKYCIEYARLRDEGRVT